MKTNLHEKFSADPDLAEDGVWREILPGIKVKIASSESRRYKLSMREAYHACGEDMARMTTVAMARGIVLDWEGITDTEGVAIPYSQEAAEQILGDPDLFVVRERIATESSTLANYRRQEIEAAIKN